MSKHSQIGIKVLSSQMMRCSFQHTDAVLETIQNIRDVASKVGQDFKTTLCQEANKAVLEARGYNNAISILGSRGSGKTSIIMTLQHILKVGKKAWEEGRSEEQNRYQYQNIIMPILVPQDFAPEQSLLSWVIVQLLEKAEEIEQEVARDNSFYFNHGGPFKAWLPEKKHSPAYDPLRECMDSLTRSFELRYKSGNNCISADVDHVYHYMDEVRRDSKLVLDMLKLISMMVDYYRYRSAQRYNDAVSPQEPLFFFAIDDLDMAPERSHEVLNLVIRYLQHPNVVVLSGWNQELFQSHLTMELLKNQGVLNSTLLNTNFDFDDMFMRRQRKRVAALDSARRLSMDNLKKAFPPALRYEIRGLNIVQRAWFPRVPKAAFTADDHESLMPLIEKTLKSCISSASPDKVGFLYNGQDEYLLIYMRIFDNKARGLVNVYRAFENLLLRVEEWDHQASLEVTPYITFLLDTILFSNTHFVPYRRGLRDLISINKIVLADANGEGAVCDYYCNYKNVAGVLRGYLKDATNVGDSPLTNKGFEMEREYNYFPSLILDTYILLNFMSNLVRYICRLPRYEHGGLEFSEALNEVNSPIKLQKNIDHLLTIAITASGLDEIALFPQTDDFRFNLCLLDAYEKNGFADRQYDFSGSYSYCRLSKALSMIGKQKDSANSKGSIVLSSNIIDGWYKKYSQWTHTIERLFEALYYSKENVQRLAKYRCFLLQGIFEHHTELLKTINSVPTETFDTFAISDATDLIPMVTDEDLDDIVYCLRQASFQRKFFSDALTRRSFERNSSTCLNVIRRAEKYMLLFKAHAKEELWDFINIAEYKLLCKEMRASTSVIEYNLEQYPNERVVSLCQNAFRCTEANINRLLWNLKFYLETSFYKNYQRMRSISDKYEYLLLASKVIGDYRRRWSLGFGTWGKLEEEAANDMVAIFRDNASSNLYAEARKLALLGPTLEGSNRSEYSIAYETIKREIRQYQFSEYETQRLHNAVEILGSAIENIRRLTGIEEDIYQVLYHLGTIIANDCAKIAYSPGLLKDKTSEERNATAWPVTEANRGEFCIWHQFKIERDIRAKKKAGSILTKFDTIS